MGPFTVTMKLSFKRLYEESVCFPLAINADSSSCMHTDTSAILIFGCIDLGLHFPATSTFFACVGVFTKRWRGECRLAARARGADLLKTIFAMKSICWWQLP